MSSNEPKTSESPNFEIPSGSVFTDTKGNSFIAKHRDRSQDKYDLYRKDDLAYIGLFSKTWFWQFFPHGPDTRTQS